MNLPYLFSLHKTLVPKEYNLYANQSLFYIKQVITGSKSVIVNYKTIPCSQRA